MLKVMDVFRIGNKLSITIEGDGSGIKNGSEVKDKNGNKYRIVSVAMTRHNSPHDISQNTTLLVTNGNIVKGDELFIVK